LRRAACHWAWRELLPAFGATPDDARVVQDGNVFSGGGVTAGIDMALTVMAEVAGVDYAQAVQLALEYAHAPGSTRSAVNAAPPSGALPRSFVQSIDTKILRFAPLQGEGADLPLKNARGS